MLCDQDIQTDFNLMQIQQLLQGYSQFEITLSRCCCISRDLGVLVAYTNLSNKNCLNPLALVKATLKHETDCRLCRLTWPVAACHFHL